MDDQSQNSQKKPQDPTLLPIPKELPILPLHGFVFFPGMGFPLQIASATSRHLVDEAMEGDRMIGLVLYPVSENLLMDLSGPISDPQWSIRFSPFKWLQSSSEPKSGPPEL